MSPGRIGSGTTCLKTCSRAHNSLRHTPTRSASPHPGRPAACRMIGSGDCTDAEASVVVEAFLDQLFLDVAPVRVKRRVLEVLLELQVNGVLAGAILLDRQDRPVSEALR